MSHSKEAPTLWDILDGVLVINLDHRTDRWMDVQAALSPLVPAGKLQRISAVWGKDLSGYGKLPWFQSRKRDATWAARAGCILSHRKAIHAAKMAGWNTFLILEDDIVPTPAFAELIGPLGTALGNGSILWDICYLGYTDPISPFRSLVSLDANHHLSQVFGCNCTHAYLLRGSISDWILAHLPDEATIWSWVAWHRAIDRWYRRNLACHFNVMAVTPSIIIQNVGFSDITERQAGTGGHRISVPQGDQSSGYWIRTSLRCAINRGLNFYDLLRSVSKRLRGF